MTDVSITKITDGLGFGEGSIAFANASSQAIESALQVITSPAIIVPVDTDADGKPLADDGCGDGRPVNLVMQGDITYGHSLNRAKVFGGGATMAMATSIGLSKAQDRSLLAVFEAAMARMDQRGQDFGAHTDTAASGANCGCGAIDRAPAIIRAASTYAANIRATIATLGVDAAGLEGVLIAYQDFATTLDDQTDYAGEATMQDVKAEAKVIKQLAGTHKEAFIILNTVPGMTVNQEAVRTASDGAVQAFGVDVWRMQAIADALYDDLQDQHKAFLSELVYTLATAAVLTAGDLPVYVVTSVPSLA